ncbi:MAG: ATP-binding protein [Treponema sp.]|nr:ATP-binding protein [Treponema sp.]
MKKDIKKANQKFSFVYILFFLSSIAMLIVAVIFSFFIKDIEKERINSIQNHLLVAAQRASTFLSVEELDLFHTAEDMERPEWNEIRTRLKRFAEETSVLYVYYWRYDGGDYIQYIIDNDEDEEYMVTPAMFFSLDSDEISGEAALVIKAGGSWVTELGVYSESWDGLLTAVVPVFNNDGTVYCGAGVDISDEVFMTMRRNIRIMEFALIFSLFVSFLSGFFGMRSYNKKAIQSANESLSKSRFLSNMSHEIRTPMNAILGIAEVQLQDNTLKEESAQAFRRIYESGDLLLNIINDILDLSKIEAGKLELTPMEYELPKLINDIAQLNRLWFNSKALSFIVNVDKETPSTLFGDELRIKQILSNLLSNAYKYTEKGEIKMSVSIEPSVSTDTGENSGTVTLLLQISDTGQGMTLSQLNHIFDAYSRFNAEENHDVTGAGLGMNITKYLVDMMKGKIIIESEVGKGTIVTVRLPQKSCGAEVCGAGIAEELRTFSFRNKSISKISRLEYKKMPNNRVLIVDDVKTNLYVAKGLLQPYDLQIETVTSGFEAIEKIKNNEEYDIIFMDHMMPKMDGIEAAKIIRETGFTNPIVAFTANAVVGQAEMFLTNGFDAFIAKPIDSYELDQILKRFIKDNNKGETE